MLDERNCRKCNALLVGRQTMVGLCPKCEGRALKLEQICAGCRRALEAYPCGYCGKSKAADGGPIGYVFLGGVVLVLLALIWTGGRAVVSEFSGPTRAGPALPELPPEISVPIPDRQVDLRLTVDGCTRSGDYLRTSGSVRNAGDVTAHFVQVRLTWQDRTGSTVDTGMTYAVGNEQLRPGESSAFEYSTRHPSASSCDAELHEWRIPR